ncbi:EamA family transporter [Candidatus Dojkabacteria bacterium]|nr:EamA family transporter [Candidatus Dojkabacteria bacterium]
MKKKTRGIILLLISALLYSSISILIRVLDQGGLPPVIQVLTRYIFGFMIASVFYALTAKKRFDFKSRGIPLLVVSAIVGYGLTNLFFTFGVINTQIGNALFFFYSWAVIAPVLAYLILREQLNKFNIVALVIVFLALLLLFSPNSLPTWKIGAVFSLLAALGQSFYVVVRRKLTYSSQVLMVANTLFGTLTMLLLAIVFEWEFMFNGGILEVTFQTWLVGAIFGAVNFSAWYFMSKGFEYVQAKTGSIILLIENVFALLWAFLIYSEIPTVWTFLGGVLLFVAGVMVILKGEN